MKTTLSGCQNTRWSPSTTDLKISTFSALKRGQIGEKWSKRSVLCLPGSCSPDSPVLHLRKLHGQQFTHPECITILHAINSFLAHLSQIVSSVMSFLWTGQFARVSVGITLCFIIPYLGLTFQTLFEERVAGLKSSRSNIATEEKYYLNHCGHIWNS